MRIGELFSDPHSYFMWGGFMSQATLEQAIKVVKALLPEDRDRLKKWLQEEEQRGSEKQLQEELQLKEARFRQALKWIDEHHTEYLNQWVALDGDRLLSHGTNAKQVYEEAQALGIEVPLLHRISETDNMPFGGW